MRQIGLACSFEKIITIIMDTTGQEHTITEGLDSA